ncbi:MAG: ribonuclease R [Flavobacteriia bacterium]|nr:ribonuclease R [Flavobacteriia bacterium]
MRKQNGKKSNKLKQSLIHVIRKVFEKNPGAKLTHKQVCEMVDVRDNALRKLVYTILQDLAVEKYLKTLSHGEYVLIEDTANYVEGTLSMSARGAGFVMVSKEVKDIYIAPENVNQSLNGDVVKVQIIKKGPTRTEGRIIAIVERERTQFVGVIQMHENFAFLIPDNTRAGTDIYIPKEKLNGAKDGEKCLVKITVWPKSAGNPFGEVIECLGKKSTNDTEMLSILCNNGIEFQFPNEVLSQAETVGMDLDPLEIEKRRDFRNITTFTIDPVDAKDFDDALSYQILENGHLEIGIHIADVSHYVTPGSPMDIEALKRSNSVYLVDRVVPMLPEQLSNMACSLRPHEDKYSFSAVFEMDENGKIYNEWFGKTVIHSDRRFSYEEAQEIIEGKEGDYQTEIRKLDAIAKLYRGKRMKNGALSIESEEMRFKLDEEGMPVEVMIKVSKDAHKLVEEFMLLANRKVAEFIGIPKKGRDQIPFVYRCHDKPDETKIGVFNVFIDKFGYKLDFTAPDQIAKSINKLLDDIRLTNEYSIIQTMAIRSMAKASYETKNIGHYGLAFEHYTHFTSPIRRYADLVVHRIVFEELNAQKHKYGKELDDVCKRISRMERKAVDAERDSTKYFQVLFVQDKIGEEFEGIVSGLTEHGLFVKMIENQCEGLVAMSDIPGDRFYFDQEKFSVIGAKTKKEYNFGDKVRVKIYEVHFQKRQIDLEML